MTKQLIITLCMLSAAVSYAQNDEYEIETVEKNIAKENDDDIALDEFKASNDASDTSNSPQINIYNANSNASKQAQKAKQESKSNQESTQDSSDYVERANEIRNNRKNMEVGTEQKMIEKIEWSRIEDEKERANRLFGNRLEKKDKHETEDFQDDYKQEKPQVIVVEKPVAQHKIKTVDEVTTETESSEEFWGRETYIAPVAGAATYGSADNVRGDMALGVMLGSRLDSGFAVEGTFLYSSYEMDDYAMSLNNPGLKDVNQYNFTMGLKYNFDLGRVSPSIGALLGYTYRQYDEKKIANTGSSDSNAFDAGLSAGLDVKVAKNFSIGAEYRIMRNVTYDRAENQAANQNLMNQQANNPNTANRDVRPLEELGYQMFLVNGKLSF